MIKAATVHKMLAKHYPPHVLNWVHKATWRHDPGVPLTKIDMARRPGSRDPAKVAGIAAAIKAGKPMAPIVLVDTGDPKLKIADGYHRTLAHAHAGKGRIPALIGSGAGKTGPWDKRMHAAKLNLSADEHVHAIDLAGVCTGPGPCDTTPLGTGNNWVNKAGGLPAYIRAVAHAMTRKGDTESESIQRAIGIVRNWAQGKGNVTAQTRAQAVKALAQWEALKTKAHALATAQGGSIDLADAPGQRYKHGWIPLKGADLMMHKRTESVFARHAGLRTDTDAAAGLQASARGDHEAAARHLTTLADKHNLAAGHDIRRVATLHDKLGRTQGQRKRDLDELKQLVVNPHTGRPGL